MKRTEGMWLLSTALRFLTLTFSLLQISTIKTQSATAVKYQGFKKRVDKSGDSWASNHGSNLTPFVFFDR